MTMDHAIAKRNALAEAYVMDLLDDAQRAEFEQHFFTCAACAEDLRTLSLFVDDTREVLREGGRAPAKAAGGGWARRRDRRRWNPGTIAAAATLALCMGTTLYLSAVVIPDYRRELAQERAPRATSRHFLSVARSDAPTIRVAPGQRSVLLVLSPSNLRGAARYAVALRDANNHVLQTGVVDAPGENQELEMDFNIGDLAPGRYRIDISADKAEGSTALQPSSAPNAVQYHFELIREENTDESQP
jgi:anti-sigma factor RsiW